MPNTYFQFKQFRIDQGQSAMKVTTEACILGAWVDVQIPPQTVLDIGTGTGLLALMLAQKFPQAEIDAVEVEEKAYAQAQFNFRQSPWPERLKVHSSRIQDFHPRKKYDLIISNPPFFNRSLLSPDTAVNQARHDAGLPQADLVAAVTRLLNEEGVLYVIYPPEEAAKFDQLAAHNDLYLINSLNVYHSPDQEKALRSIGRYLRVPDGTSEQSLVIRNEKGSYTKQFEDLLRPYYLLL